MIHRSGLSPDVRAVLDQVFVSNGLRTSHGVVPPASIAIRIDQVSGSNTSILFAETPMANSEMLWTANEAVNVAADDVWFGDVVTYDAGTTINGEVLGSIIAIGGDVTLGRGASVRGDVIVIGGILRQRPDAKVYGRVFAPGGHRRPRLFIPSVGELEERGYVWRPTVSYDRVDGLRPGIGGTVVGDDRTLELKLWTGYALASETWQYRFGLGKHLFESRRIHVGGALYRLTMTQDSMVIGRDENTVYSLVAGSDYRDYVGIDGGELAITWKYGEFGNLTAVYQNHDFRPLTASVNLWHLFRSNDEFRPNFSTLDLPMPLDSIYRGHSSALILSVRVAPVISGQHPIGFNGSFELEYEVAGGALGGRFDYDRITLSGKGWWDSGRMHKLMVRMMIGSGRRELPPHKLYYIGGMGTLRGYGQKEFAGDEMFVTNMEYHFKYWENPFGDAAVILLFDAGNAKFDESPWHLDNVKSNIGIGLDFGGAIRFNAAKALDEADRDVRFTLKLSRPL
ncbi:MAG: hypothetical protein Kow0074_21760 [Candidatus Zixiibacteriota bacterium]